MISEALAVAGGVFAWGNLVFRLLKEALRIEIERIHALGVELRSGQKLGRDFTDDQLFESPHWFAVGRA